MKQLLSITSVNTEYKLNISPARASYSSQKTNVNYQRQEGKFEMVNEPAKLLINTTDLRNSMTPTVALSLRQTAQKGHAAARDAAAQYSAEAVQLREAKIGQDPIAQIAAQRVALPTGEFQLGFIPSVQPEIQFQEPNYQTMIEADKMVFDTRVQRGDLEYTHWDVSAQITQFPDVQIEYMGKPHYVPPSADPNFEASA